MPDDQDGQRRPTNIMTIIVVLTGMAAVFQMLQSQQQVQGSKSAAAIESLAHEIRQNALQDEKHVATDGHVEMLKMMVDARAELRQLEVTQKANREISDLKFDYEAKLSDLRVRLRGYNTGGSRHHVGRHNQTPSGDRHTPVPD